MIFSIQPNSGRESFAIMNNAVKLGSDFQISKECLPDSIPIGSVEYCESILDPKDQIRNFYPDFLKEYLGRKVELVELKDQIFKDKFFKLATKWKADFKSQVISESSNLPQGFYYVSDIVKFVQEWRYYVLNGKLITTGWYDGHDEDEPAPELKIEYPANFSGAVDFGRTDDGKVLLVECHAPYACGWYGEDNYDYAYWIFNAYPSYLNNQKLFYL